MVGVSSVPTLDKELLVEGRNAIRTVVVGWAGKFDDVLLADALLECVCIWWKDVRLRGT
jgi:hypothetical protein